jgi:hypothetical protein
MRVYAAMMLLLTLFGCSRSIPAPERPKNVPATAMWSGGPDGGDWFDCDYDPKRDWNNCTVYSDVTGVVGESGRFRLKDEKRAARKEELRYSYYSLGEIHLSNNQMLVRIDKPNDE